MNIITKRISILFLALAYLLCLCACGNEKKTSDGPKPSENTFSQTTSQKSQAINFIEVNIDSMVKELKDNALAASDKYKNKRLKITGGYLGVIDSDGKYISLKGKRTFLQDVHASLTTPQQREQIKRMKREQPLTLYVEITDVGEIMGYVADIIKIEIPGAPVTDASNTTTYSSSPVNKSNQVPNGNNNATSTLSAITANAVVNAGHSSADKEGDYLHSALLTIDNNTRTCWAEGVPGLGIGEYIVINFNGMYRVNGMYIWPGHQKTEALYLENARPTAIRVIGSDGSNEVYSLRDAFGAQSVSFKKPINVFNVKIIVEKVAPGTKYEDTCIAEVKFF